MWSAADEKSVTCSIESTCLTRMAGVDDFAVDFNGNGRLNPQSPRILEDSGVVTACNVGNAFVAESEL